MNAIRLLPLSWTNYVALLLFMMLPFFIAHRLKAALIYYKYVP